MILSVSRRTDVPSFYLDWFLNRLREGWLLVRNPFNPSQVSKVLLSPEVVECIVFWTKNPEPMLGRLDELAAYTFYVQYTVNPYGKDMESRLPGLSHRLDVFRELASRLGLERVVWRYSPVLVNAKYTDDFHCEAFENIATTLSGSTRQCKLSFIELYQKISASMDAQGVVERGDERTFALARKLDAIAARHGIALSACGKPDLRPAGIAVSSCVDGELIRKITGKDMSLKKDSGQRGVCNCVESVDIGTYQTCLNGCAYCYANHSHETAKRRAEKYDPDSPLLCDALKPDDKVTERRVKVHCKAAKESHQLPLFHTGEKFNR